MNKVQKIDYVKKVSNHLEEKNVFEIFEKLTRELIVHQPKNPIDFLIDRLKNPSGKHNFIQKKNYFYNSQKKVSTLLIDKKLEYFPKLMENFFLKIFLQRKKILFF